MKGFFQIELTNNSVICIKPEAFVETKKDNGAFKNY